MSIEPFKPGPSGSPLVENGKIVGHVSFSGDILSMPVGRKTVQFLLHRWFGPEPISKKTQYPLERIPKGFWDAYERWDIGGRMVDGDTCVVREWCQKCDGSGDNMRHLGGRHHIHVGNCKTCNGERLAPQCGEKS